MSMCCIDASPLDGAFLHHLKLILQWHDCIIQLAKHVLWLPLTASHDTIHIQQTCNRWWEGLMEVGQPVLSACPIRL